MKRAGMFYGRHERVLAVDKEEVLVQVYEDALVALFRNADSLTETIKEMIPAIMPPRRRDSRP